MTIINTTFVTFCKEVIAGIKNIEREGELQYNRYLNERLIMGKVSINAKIHRNTFSMMNTDLETKSSSAGTVNTTILMNKLRSAAAYRPDQVAELFEGEMSPSCYCYANVCHHN